MTSNIPTAIEVQERHPEPTLSLEVARQHVESLKALREKAYGRLLHPKWTFNASVRPYDIVDESVSRRQLPALAQHGGTYSFLLTEALQPFMPTGNIHNGHWSQVWVATARSIDDNTMDHGTVILKIFQPSLLPIPYPANLSYVRRSSALHIANTESSTYQHLKSVQGAAVPYFFGQYELRMPNGDNAQVIVMEYIPGMNLEKWCSRYRRMERNDRQREIERELPKILLSAYNSAKAINSCNIIHRDVKPQNMLIYAGAGEEEVVFVDFGFSQTAKTLKKKRQWAEPERAVIWIVQLCSEHYGDEPKLEKWARVKGNLPKGCTWNRNSVEQL